jgi:hypothetical protein
MADAVRNKSSLTAFAISHNNIGDKGRSEAVNKKIVMGGECRVASSSACSAGRFGCAFVLKAHCSKSVAVAALIRNPAGGYRVAGQIEPQNSWHRPN